MTRDRKEKMLEKVRGLIAKASSTEFEAEAESFRAKADELMTAYAIAEWEVAKADGAGAGESGRPVVRKVEFKWYYDRKLDADIRDALWSMYLAVGRHCRVVVGIRGLEYGVGPTMPLIGTPSDLDYFDALFTSLMVQMIGEMLPKVDRRRGATENAYKLRSLGRGWYKVAEMLVNAEMEKLPRGVEVAEFEQDGEQRFSRADSGMGFGLSSGRTRWAMLTKKERESVKNRIASRVRTYRRAEGLEDYTEVHPGVFARSYAEGFESGVAEQLRRIRAQREGSGSGSSGRGSGMEVALRDIRKAARDLYDETYPAEESGRSGGSMAVDRRARDGRAEDRGRDAGRRARVANPAGERVGGKRKGIDR